MSKENKILIFGSLFALILISSIIGFNYLYLFNYTTEARGTFGDMFGLSNALFSGLAFAGLIITILLQRNEIKLQREDLEITRQELKLNTKELKETKETFALQRFENTFFKLLELQNTITTNIQFQSTNKKYQGREVFIILKKAFEGALSRDFINNTDNVQNKEQLYELFESFFVTYYDKEVSQYLSVYFRSLQSILEFLDSLQISSYSSEKIEEIKSQYAVIIQSQFSDYELYWIYYNGLCEKGKLFFKPLIEKYSILKFHSNTLEVKNKQILRNKSVLKLSENHNAKFTVTYDDRAYGRG